jgi:predicted Zn-dependent peptidase
MSSRLFQEIREKAGLAYSVYSFLSSYMDAGLLGVYAATEPRHLNPVLSIVHREIRELCEGSLSEPDLASAKEHIIGGIYLSSESTDNQMMRLARNEFAFGRHVSYEEVANRIEAVSAHEVVDAANRIFRDEPIAFTAIGSIDEEAVDRNCLWYH